MLEDIQVIYRAEFSLRTQTLLKVWDLQTYLYLDLSMYCQKTNNILQNEERINGIFSGRLEILRGEKPDQ